MIASPVGQVEVWIEQAGVAEGTSPRLFVLKLLGTGGRAERASDHPADVWSDVPLEIWSVNPPGYGGSQGGARLAKLAPAASAVYETLLREAAGAPLLLTGNSLGTAVALHLATRGEAAGLLLRNAVPLRELIVGHHGWWNLSLGARLIADQMPPELDSIRNAAQVSLPSVWLSSQRDRVAPPVYQRQVIDAYAGPRRIVALAEADHATLLTPAEQAAYATQLNWLRAELGL